MRRAELESYFEHFFCRASSWPMCCNYRCRAVSARPWHELLQSWGQEPAPPPVHPHHLLRRTEASLLTLQLRARHVQNITRCGSSWRFLIWHARDYPHPTPTPPQMTQMHILFLCTPYNPCVFKLTWTFLPPPHPTPTPPQMTRMHILLRVSTCVHGFSEG